MSASISALFFTVVLLVATAYFIMGGLPLLILQHDTAVDGRFIRRFFEVYYKGALVAAIGATASYALWGRPAFAAGMAGVAAAVVGLRRLVIPAMEQLGTKIQDSSVNALSSFRRVHSAALLMNLLLLVAMVWGVTQLSL